MGPNKESFVAYVTFAALVVSGLNVDDVHLSTHTAWVTTEPAHLMCEVSTYETETLEEIRWHRNGQIVYQWFQLGGFSVSGPLENHVEFPTDLSDWNLKITPISYSLEGNFTCEAITQQGVTSAKSFEFILFYNEGASNEFTPSPLADCNLQIELDLPKVFPRPRPQCRMVKDDFQSDVIRGFQQVHRNDDSSYAFNFTAAVWLGDYPRMSYLRCTNDVYDGQIEIFKHQPVIEGAMTCPELPDTLRGFIVDRANSSLSPGCRNDFRSGSEALYTCREDKTVVFSSVCTESGKWSPDVYDNQVQVPRCTGARSVESVLLVALALVVVCFE